MINIIFWMLLEIPWKLAFPLDHIPYIDPIILFFFFVDIVLQFRTTYYTENKDEIIDAKLIFKNYVKKKEFWIDVLSSLPIDELYSGENDSIIRILTILKIVRLGRLNKLTEIIKGDNVKLISQLIQYLVGWTLAFHWISCIWVMIIKTDLNLSTQFIIHHSSDHFEITNTWFPNHQRAVYQNADESQKHRLMLDFYFHNSNFEFYINCYYSMLLTVLGNDICNFLILALSY